MIKCSSLCYVYCNTHHNLKTFFFKCEYIAGIAVCGLLFSPPTPQYPSLFQDIFFGLRTLFHHHSDCPGPVRPGQGAGLVSLGGPNGIQSPRLPFLFIWIVGPLGTEALPVGVPVYLGLTGFSPSSCSA